MCEIKDLNATMRIIVLNTKDGNTYVSGSFIDKTEKEENLVNRTRKEGQILHKLIQKNKVKEENIDNWYISRKRENGIFYISDHAYERLKERCGWKKKTANRMIRKVVDEGTEWKETKGYIRHFIDGKMDREKCADQAILYGMFLYIFSNNTLLTVLRVPRKREDYSEVGSERQF